MSRHEKPATNSRFAFKATMPSFTPRLIYLLLPDESAAKSNYVRVVDNEGEDYLYPAEYFMFLDLADEIKRAWSRAA